MTPEAVAAALDKNPKLRAVFVQLNESSTGVAHDVEAIGRIVRGRPDTLLVVDAISGAGAIRLETEAWGVDIAIVGSQKALALPPGLAFLSLSTKAWEQIGKSGSARFYFDLRARAQGAGWGRIGLHAGHRPRRRHPGRARVRDVAGRCRCPGRECRDAGGHDSGGGPGASACRSWRRAIMATP